MHITVKTVATESAVTVLSFVIAVTLKCTSLSQHCHYRCCHNAVLVFAATALCLFSLSRRCAHRCLTAAGFLLCINPVKAKPFGHTHTVERKGGGGGQGFVEPPQRFLKWFRISTCPLACIYCLTTSQFA